MVVRADNASCIAAQLCIRPLEENGNWEPSGAPVFVLGQVFRLPAWPRGFYRIPAAIEFLLFEDPGSEQAYAYGRDGVSSLKRTCRDLPAAGACAKGTRQNPRFCLPSSTAVIAGPKRKDARRVTRARMPEAKT